MGMYKLFFLCFHVLHKHKHKQQSDGPDIVGQVVFGGWSGRSQLGRGWECTGAGLLSESDTKSAGERNGCLHGEASECQAAVLSTHEARDSHVLLPSEVGAV